MTITVHCVRFLSGFCCLQHTIPLQSTQLSPPVAHFLLMCAHVVGVQCTQSDRHFSLLFLFHVHVREEQITSISRLGLTHYLYMKRNHDIHRDNCHAIYLNT